MRIGINALFLIPGEVGGTEIVTRGLVAALAGSPEIDSLVVFTNAENHAAFESDRAALGPAGRKIELAATGLRARSRPRRILYEQFALPGKARAARVDLLHSTGYVAPAWGVARSIVDIYDLNYRAHPEDFGALSRIVLGVLTPLSARRAQAVCALTETAKAELARELKIPAKKIHVVPCAVDENFRRPVERTAIDALRARLGLPERYFLTPSATHPHKNLLRLAEAFALIAKEDAGMDLVVCGSPGRAHAQVLQAVRERGLERRVHFPAWMAAADMPPLYQGAQAMVLPTLYEGFGRPLIEAFAAGLPAAVSDIPVLREVGADAARYFDPLDPQAIAHAMQETATDAVLRARLIDAGRHRAAFFSPGRSLAASLAVYRSVLGRQGDRAERWTSNDGPS